MNISRIVGYIPLDDLNAIKLNYPMVDPDTILKYVSLRLKTIEDYLEDSVPYDHFFDEVPKATNLAYQLRDGNPEAAKIFKLGDNPPIVKDLNIYLFDITQRLHKSIISDLKAMRLKHCLLDQFYITLVKNFKTLNISGVLVYVIEIFYGKVPG